MNKRQSLHHSQSKVVCQNFFNLWLLNTKKSVPLTDSDVQTLLGEEENQNTKKKKPKPTYSVPLVMEFFTAENENRALEDLP